MPAAKDPFDFALEGSSNAYDAIVAVIKTMMEGNDFSAKQIVFALACNAANALLQVNNPVGAYYQFQQAFHLAFQDGMTGGHDDEEEEYEAA